MIFLIIKRLFTDAEEIGNCSQVFTLMDTNYNHYVGLYEAIVALATYLDEFGFQENVDWELKLKQLDCSACVQNKTVYYM